MLRNLVFLFCMLFCAIQPSFSAEAINKKIPNAAVVGHGVLTYAFWDVYKATLYAPGGNWRANKPQALLIKYKLSIKGKDIANRSVQEMRKQGFTDEVKLAEWNAQMKNIFPDVKNGSVLSAIYTPGRYTAFYSGDTLIGKVKGDLFGQKFFGIWLNEKTSEPALRLALLGRT